MTAFAVVLFTFPLAAEDPSISARDAIAAFASALANDNVQDALWHLGKPLKDDRRFTANLRALLEQNEVTSSISPQSNEGDGRKRTLELDWYLEVRSKSGELAFSRRRELVRCTVEKLGKTRWMITSFEPLSFFSKP